MSDQTNSIEPISSFRLMHWACQGHSALMAAYQRSGTAYIATSLDGYVRYFAELARRLANELYSRNATRTLQQCDDHISGRYRSAPWRDRLRRAQWPIGTRAKYSRSAGPAQSASRCLAGADNWISPKQTASECAT